MEQGQQVFVDVRVTTAGGAASTGRAQARWDENRGENSYWTATIGPFADGDRVEYRAVGSVRGGTSATEWVSFTVRPSIHLALLWHHHQPVYRAFGVSGPGTYRFPWVRLHAIRDYFGMAELVAQHPGVHVTFNFSPALLWQLEDYIERGATDRALLLSTQPPARLGASAQQQILETFFDADWHRQIYPHRRYRELLERRTQRLPFSTQDLADLVMWFNLAWFAHEFRTGTVTLPDGTAASVQRFVEQGRGFSHRDIEAVLDVQQRVMASVIPLHRAMQDRGQIEVAVSPFYHPILPLLVDTDRATLDRPGTTLPGRFTYPQDAEAQVATAVDFYQKRFGMAARGMWPAEGAVADCVLPLFARHGIRWIASDEGVLARSGRHGYRTEDAGVLCQPYRAPTPDGELSILFRSRALSDAIGFRCHLEEPAQAAAEFVASVKDLARELRGDRDYLVPVILDGENAWGSYRDDGRPFLHALYGALAEDVEIKTVTVSEYLEGNAARRLAAHPTGEQTMLYQLFTGSWIDEPDSVPGVDLGTWIGEPEENAAWDLLRDVRCALDRAGVDAASNPAAFEALYAAEGSDWFWWLGSDHESDADEIFDDLFRAHLRAACTAAGVEPPPGLDRHIVPHRAVWTVTAPVDEIQERDVLVVRTNCSGLVALSTDGWLTTEHIRLTPCGGVLAGPGHHTATLGPFPAGTSLEFRFHCDCVECACDAEAPCARAAPWAVRVVATVAVDAAPRVGAR